MKKLLIFSLILGVMLAAGGVVVAAGMGKAGDENSRYLVKSNNGMLKMMYGVQHNFDNGFTIDLTPKRLKMLKKFGIEVEEVELYHISGKPGTLCGNGELEPGEKCEIGYTCPSGFTCENCKCVEETAPPERSCYPSTQTPWGIEKVNGGSGGAGVKVAVLDTGVYKDHLDLKANIVDCKDVTKRGIRKGCADNNGHGTHVAGTILANGGGDEKGIYGVAPEAKLMAIKVCGANGCWGDDIAEAIRYAADNGANIISMSLGGNTQSTLIKDAINYAVGEGVLVVAAAGNDGPSDGSIDYPGANAKVVAVGAIDSAENVASWSSRGINDGDWTIEEREIEFAAPGVHIKSTWKNGCYNTISGTSMATPHIAGIAARDWQGSAGDTRTCLQDLARAYTENINGIDYGLDGDDIEAGFGLPIIVN